MNNLQHTLVELGKWFNEEAILNEDLLKSAEAHNGWFTKDSVATAMKNHASMLSSDSVSAWFAENGINDSSLESNGKTLGLITAGNLPLVGWHDILCGLVCGFSISVKASRDDQILPKEVVSKLEEIAPELKGRITFVEGKLGEVDALIATGNANTTRYFESYFSHIPHIFRSQRTGVAVLDGNESDEDLSKLGDDMFTHFGLGCRSTTKIFLPEGFDLDRCFTQWVKWGEIGNHNKYANNYDYHKAIWLLNGEDLIENGFLLVKKDAGWVSPVGTIFVEFYKDLDLITTRIADYAEGIQVVTARKGWGEFENILNSKSSELPIYEFGQAQCPQVDDYADGVNTIKFLQGID
ncbi:MAG: acyl-CoA reductase [Crocinitomicaceae bacterium]|nr:acyl-CoA reductase [Crocinitomicaceae bacterium]